MPTSRSRLLLLLPTTTYRTEAFVDAATKLGVELVCASERPSTLQELAPDSLVTLDFGDPLASAETIARFARRRPIDAVVAVDDPTTVVAAAISQRLGLKANSLPAASVARDKHAMRRCLASAGVPVPRFQLVRLADDPAALAQGVEYPCVLKPLALSASRGVIRANDAQEFVAAFRRIAAILETADAALPGEARTALLVEEFIPGREVALEGLLVGGTLHVLALFDKPDPLEGPFFEETIYVTPSRRPETEQARIAAVTRDACSALGLTEGPIHAELRENDRGPFVLEVAARSIGGLCSRTLRFGTGLSLEELILSHALGRPLQSLERERRAAGVMMIPIPRAGRLIGVGGTADAAAVDGIEEVAITMHPGQEVVPLPEGWQYLGFIFARAETPAAVEHALRRAHARLHVDIE
ncbi:MAG TPA: ATP-grasp domain-containing protein [Candidatus Binatia bacterium]|nr:ATP-grasp domain-containing protein [Candidatus Binatia bacterium]